MACAPSIASAPWLPYGMSSPAAGSSSNSIRRPDTPRGGSPVAGRASIRPVASPAIRRSTAFCGRPWRGSAPTRARRTDRNVNGSVALPRRFGEAGEAGRRRWRRRWSSRISRDCSRRRGSRARAETPRSSPASGQRLQLRHRLVEEWHGLVGGCAVRQRSRRGLDGGEGPAVVGGIDRRIGIALALQLPLDAPNGAHGSAPRGGVVETRCVVDSGCVEGDGEIRGLAANLRHLAGQGGLRRAAEVDASRDADHERQDRRHERGAPDGTSRDVGAAGSDRRAHPGSMPQPVVRVV